MPEDRFILGGSPVILHALSESFANDPGVVVLSMALNADSLPDRLVVEMTPERAREMEKTLGPAILIEPDLPIQFS